MELILLLSLCLLGSARGAPGQPDRPLEFIDNHASVQQLSSEYFSLANPSRIEALYEASGKKTLTEHSSTEHNSSEHAASDHAGEHTSQEQHSDEQPLGEKSLSEEVSEDQSADEQAADEKSTGEHASAEESGEYQQPSGDQASAEQPSDEQPSDEETSEQPSNTTFSSTSSGTSVKCHACAYMTNEEKCLRGEGTCTTQNSQQCMLKKIFEGGKLQFMVQACENMCPSMTLLSHGTRMQIICCQNEHFCNAV